MERSDSRNGKEHMPLEIPMPDGSTELFLIQESPVMDWEISQRYPDIKSYKGFSAVNALNQIRFAVTPKGFHASLFTESGEIYIDPYSSENNTDYQVYYTHDYKDYSLIPGTWCGASDSGRPSIGNLHGGQRGGGPLVELRVYRLAMGCTGEWGAKRGTVAKCMEDLNIVVTRMNQIYERELAIRFVLINTTDKLIFIDGATDPYDTPLEGKKMVGSNTSKINAIIESNSYDIGHVFTVGCTDGIAGVAQLGSLCQLNKGNGVTCQGSQSLSVIVTRVLAHEVGHQLDASHTWNRCTGSEDQRASNTAFEPGSGSTIMSYAGSCGGDNITTDNDDYFHVGSLEQMRAKTLAIGNAYSCAQKINSGNTAPVLMMPGKTYTIPVSTPFELGASAMDQENDAMTYNWEQYDTGENAALGTSTLTGALFRSFKPSTTGDVRFFPKAINIVGGNFTDKTEVLPTSTRKLSFKFSVRDNNPTGSGVSIGDYAINVSDQAGPFKITYPLLDDAFKVGQKVTVTWDVANTDKTPVNCKAVNIYASYNGVLRTGDPNLISLALNVPNDGSHEVIIPNKVSTFFRIVIKAADNIFLTSSIYPSKVELPTVPGFIFETNQDIVNICQPNNGVITLNTVAFGGYDGDISFQVASTLPDGVTATFTNSTVKVGNAATLTINTVNLKSNQSVQLLVKASGTGLLKAEKTITVNITSNNLSNIVMSAPANGASSVQALPTFSWAPKADALTYDIQVATNPAFAPEHTVINVTQTSTNYVSSQILNKSTIYYWRVRASNACSSGNWSDINAFSTEALACKTYLSGEQSLNISASGSPSVEIPLIVNEEGSASDINVKLIRAEHNRLVDLDASIISPSGKSIALWSRKCGTQKNINVGLDDQSPDLFQCPINTGKVYQPENLLAGFQNESIKGKWILRIDDKQSGEGGKLQEFNLEICAKTVISNPFIVKNETLKIHPGNNGLINNTLLLASDSDNTAAELIYTLVSAPGQGNLMLKGTPIKVGATFSQSDIDAGSLIFDDTSDKEGNDFFTFTVKDGKGGWITITKYNILKDKSIPNPTNDPEILANVYINPVPSSGDVYVSLVNQATVLEKYDVVNLAGVTVLSGQMWPNVTKIDLTELPEGLYILKLSGANKQVSKRIIKY
jgi:subtilisin-like proprotein convertase family protein